MSLSYEKSGVRYDQLDAFNIAITGIDHIVAGSDYPHQIGSIAKMIATVGANAGIYAANARKLLKLA